jgi:predicted molibdopterin-dependent oxidoreductase YjgC
MGENPILSDPNQTHVVKALHAVDFLVVQDIFLNETAQYADVVLPAISFAEKAGTFTNTERRVHLVRKAIEPKANALPDWEILTRLANAMGAGWSYSNAAEIFDELASLTPQYAGISHSRLEDGGLQWPCPTPDHPGTPILHVGKFARGLGLFSAVEFKEAVELPDPSYPLILSTGRVLFHWHGGTMSRRSPELDSLAPVAEVEIHPDDAGHYGIDEGDIVKVESRRGAVHAQAVITRRSPPGTVFMTFHFAEAAANLLTTKNIDPVAKIPEYKVSAVRIEPVAEPIRE